MKHYLYRDGLESSRIKTRFLSSGDVLWWADFFEDPEAMRFLDNVSGTAKERAQHMIEKQLTRYNDRRFGLQVLMDKQSSVPAGLCGLLLQEVENKMEIEIGYHLLPGYRGKGYATEAAAIFKNFAFQNQLASSIISIIDRDNLRSQAVAKRNGMEAEKHLLYFGSNVIIFRIWNQS